MLFHRFALITACTALMGIGLSQLIETTQRKPNEFSVTQRLEQWKELDTKRACAQNPKLCEFETISSQIQRKV